MTRPDARQTGPCKDDAEVSPSRIPFPLSTLCALSDLCGSKNCIPSYEISGHSSFQHVKHDRDCSAERERP